MKTTVSIKILVILAASCAQAFALTYFAGKRNPETQEEKNMKYSTCHWGSSGDFETPPLPSKPGVNDTLAMLCTYWGMYQIRGSNWRLCGAESVRDFVEKMSQSEDMQHRLFANYIKNTGLYRPLQAHDWAAFARAYNGEGYARHGYHTRLAAAYARYSRRGTPQSTSK